MARRSDLADQIKDLDHHNLLFLETQEKWLKKARDKQILPIDGWNLAIAQAGRGWGKALALNTPIPTPTGWATMGELRDGDTVLSGEGVPCRVTTAHPVLFGRRCFRVHFSDGSSIVADEDHLWATLSGVVPTKYIAASIPGGDAKSVIVPSPDELVLRHGTSDVSRRDPRTRVCRRYIVNVESVPSVPVRCITVDAPSATYLAGREMIPTHNTEVGAQWAIRECHLYPGIVLHAVAPTSADLIGTMFSGISGIMSICPPDLIEKTNFSDAIPTIRFANGSMIRGFSAQAPERLRGPQASRVWGDELAAWSAAGPGKAETTLYNIDFSTRIAYRCPDGRVVQPQRFYTTTPKPLQWLAELLKKAKIIIRGSTYENRANLAADFFDDIAKYEGTSIGRQEIHGELLDLSEAAIIKQSWLKLWPNNTPLPHFDFILIVMDTALTEKTFDRKKMEADPTCCQVWGVFSHTDTRGGFTGARWNLLLLERWSDHVGMPELVRRAKKELTKEYGRRTDKLFQPHVGPAWHAEQIKRPDLLLVEDKGSGISLRQMLMEEGIETHAYNPGKADKLSRLHAISHIPAHGHTWLPESTQTPGQPRNWIEPMLDEVCIYSGPGTTKHDDDVDCFAMAHRYFADNFLARGVTDPSVSMIKKDGVIVEVPYTWLPEDMRTGETFGRDVAENFYSC